MSVSIFYTNRKKSFYIEEYFDEKNPTSITVKLKDLPEAGEKDLVFDGDAIGIWLFKGFIQICTKFKDITEALDYFGNPKYKVTK